MLSAYQLSCQRGTKRLFQGLNFSLPSGHWIQVKGPNGAGKTSLLRILCGLSNPAQGEVLWQGQNTRSTRSAFNAELHYQGHGLALKEELSATENLQSGAALRGLSVSPQAVQAALSKVGLKGRSQWPVKVLSQGQKRRVALAGLVLSSAPLWILDEPFAALDVAAQSSLQGILDQHLAQGGVLVFTSHQPIELQAPGEDLDLGGFAA
jgi:heme exporter protein A